MPSENSFWLISAPLQDSDARTHFSALESVLADKKLVPPAEVHQIELPKLKTGTLSQLVNLSDELVKHDTYTSQTVAKLVDTLRSLDSEHLQEHVRVDDEAPEDYVRHWRWNAGRYRVERNLAEITEQIVKEISSIDNVTKSKLQSYNLAKGNLTQLQRKKTGNLSVRSLAEVVKPEHVVESEFLDTLFVAVPVNLTKEWLSKYERLTQLVVPRSSVEIARDDEYVLYSVTLFKKVRDEFIQKCRENKFIVRDFEYDPQQVEKSQQELQVAAQTERELWADLLRLTRTNFSEAYQALVHLKVVRLFVESVLRYGLPAEYLAVVLRPDPKNPKKLLSALSEHFAYLAPKNKGDKKRGGGGHDDAAAAGEWAGLLEQEVFAFPLFEVPVVDVGGGSS